METQAAGHRVQQLGVVDGDGDDVGDIELEEVDLVQGAVDVGVADEDEDEEWQGDEVEDGGDDGGVAPGGRSLLGGHRGRY